MLLSHHQTAEQNHGLNVAQFRYLGMTVTGRNLIQEEIKRLSSGNAWYHSVENVLSCLLSKKMKIRLYKTNLCFCMGVEVGL
jgi:hypothetical protein